jgi:hypothetical protein
MSRVRGREVESFKLRQPGAPTRGEREVRDAGVMPETHLRGTCMPSPPPRTRGNSDEPEPVQTTEEGRAER